MADFNGVSFSDGQFSIGRTEFAANSFSEPTAAYSKGNFEVSGNRYLFSLPVYTTGVGEFALRTYAFPRANYYKMMAYDTSQNIWRTWMAAGEPDLAARQFNGVAFPFTQIFVATKL